MRTNFRTTAAAKAAADLAEFRDRWVEIARAENIVAS